VVHPFLAFGFGNLAMLGWLGAAAAPILIHLWMRHTHRDTPWAAMEFLREAIKRNARRLKLQQWLLLAVRTLLLLLLALAAAKPYLSGWNVLTGGPPMHRILVIDGSFSMQYEVEGQTLFDQAIQRAQQAIEQAPAGDVYSVCLMTDPPRTIVTGPVADGRSIAQQLSRLQPTNTSSNLEQTLDLVRETISAAGSATSKFAGHEVMFFTDLTKTSWNSATEGSGEKLLAELGSSASLVVIDVGLRDASNLFIGSPRLIGGLATTAQAVELKCEIANYGDEPLEKVTAELLIDGLTVAEQTFTLPARGETTLTFEHKFIEPGWHRLAARTAGDALPLDDEAWLAIDVRQAVRVLLVEGQRGAARYLRHALDPGGGGDSPIEPVVVPEGALIDTPLETFDCVFLVDVAQFTSQEQRLLENYTRRGGSLVFFLGDRVQPDAYNVALQHASNGVAAQPTSLLPASIGPLQTGDVFGIDPLGYRHPIARAFRGQERAGLLSTPVTTYYKLTPSDHPQVQTVLALPSGDPLLVTGKVGRGRVAVMATSASLDTLDRSTGQPWNMLPAWPSFLPIVRELVAFSTNHDLDHGKHLVAKPIIERLPDSSPATTVAVVRPDARIDTVPVVREGQELGPAASPVGWSYVSTNIPGIYAATLSDSIELPSNLRREAVLTMSAINVDPIESDLSRVDIASLPESLVVRSTADSGAAGADIVRDTSLHRPLLYAVLLLMLLDPLLAWWFGGRAA